MPINVRITDGIPIIRYFMIYYKCYSYFTYKKYRENLESVRRNPNEAMTAILKCEGWCTQNMELDMIL